MGYLDVKPECFTLHEKTFSTEASSLGFRAGRWPVSIDVEYAGKTYHATGPVFCHDREGDVMYAEYFAPGGYRFLIYND